MTVNRRIYWRGDRLANLMQQRGETNASICRKVRDRIPDRKCSPTLVSSWINIGREPKGFETLVVLADILNVPLTDLFGRSPQHAPSPTRSA